MKVLGDGRFWMRLWSAFCVFILAQSVVIALWFLDSVRAVNIMSIEALVFSVCAGFQATLAMRKADRKDSL